MAPRTPREVADWAANAQAELSKRLARRERSTHRVMTLTESYDKLIKLNLKQDKLFREHFNARSTVYIDRRTSARSPP